MTVSTNYLVEGSASSRIYDAWVYVEEDNLGAYELPNKIPVLKEGNLVVTMFPGIVRSGVTSERAIYPFYDGFESRINLVKDEVSQINPVVKYRPNVVFPWKEDFEDISISFDSVAGSNVNILRVKDPAIVFERSACGGIFVTPEKPKYTGRNQDLLTLPKFGNDVYLELDIRSNIPFDILLKAYYTSGSPTTATALTIKPTNSNGEEVWKKLYVFMTPYVSAAETASFFQVYFTCYLPNGASEGHVYLDNLKIVHQ